MAGTPKRAENAEAALPAPSGPNETVETAMEALQGFHAVDRLAGLGRLPLAGGKKSFAALLSGD
jgi:hypothetical protein